MNKFADRILRLRDEAGVGLIETMAGLTVLAIGFMALAGALGLGFKQVTLGRQRQTAAEIGNARIEHLRNVAYAQVAVRQPPDAGEPEIAHNTSTDHPDYYVANGPPKTFDYDGSDAGGYETLVIDANGGVDHIEDPVQVGETTMEIYQYVTWVDDPNIAGAQNYKRVTAIVKYKSPAIGGVTKIVRVSSLFTPGTVTTDGTASSPNPGSSPSSSPAPSPSPSGSCSGDTAAPTGSFSIQAGAGAEAGFTASASVTISMSFSDGCAPIRARFSNDNVTYGSFVTYDASNPTVSWTLTSGDGSKSVWARVRDGVDNEVTKGPETITLDATKPTVPANLGRTVSCSGNDRTVTLTWNASTDANFRGHRVYRSIDSGAWTALGTTSGTSYTDTHLKTYDSVRFKVRGYDKAGNESDDSTIISLAKNQCD